MAIYVRCAKCKTDHRVGTKKCSSCGQPLGKGKRLYKVVVTLFGKRKTKIVPTLDLAQSVESKWKGKIVREEYDLEPKRRITLGEFWEKHYLPWAKTNKKSWRDELGVWRTHLIHLADKDMHAITTWDVDAIIHTMKKKGRAPATIVKVTNILSGLFTTARKWKLYDGNNPCRDAKRPTVNNKRVAYLSGHELDALLKVLETWRNPFDAAFIKMILLTGARRGELFNLKWSDIDFEEKRLTWRDPKGKLDVTIPLSDGAIELLQSLPRTSEYVFPGRNDGQRKDFKWGWQKIKEQAGIPSNFRLHDLRHHYATTLIKEGCDLYTVKELLGHKDITTTMRYAHIVEEVKRKAVNAADKAIRRAVGSKGKVLKFQREG